jgi:uncharacterized protein DUF4153
MPDGRRAADPGMTGPLDSPERPDWIPPDAGGRGGRPPSGPSAPPEGAAEPSPEPPPRRLFLGAAVAGLVGASGLPGERPGLGVLATALAVAVGVVAVRGGVRVGWPLVWGTLSIALAAVAVLRDAQWVVWPSIVGAVALGSVAVGGVSWRGPFAALAAAPRGLTTAARGLPSPPGARALPVLRGSAIAAVLLVVFGLLFASGDAAFAQLAEQSLPSDVALGLLPWRVVVFGLVAALAAGLALASPRETAPAAPARRLGTVEWAIPLAALDLLFAAFVAIQLAVLFGGDERVLDTAGLTYSEYAREGYGQLLAAAALTLAVVAGSLRWSGGDRRLLRALLGVLCVLTGVVLASSLHRLDLYQDAFGATRLRVTATATLLWLGAILVLVLARLATDRPGFLPRASLLVTALAGLGFALWNPDLRIAERNLARDDPDRAYLATLSADAAPALPPPLRADRGDDGWGGFNLARR